jgi:hypothetical protein
VDLEANAQLAAPPSLRLIGRGDLVAALDRTAAGR